MLYFIFITLAILYNLKKFNQERSVFLRSLTEAKNPLHREMILGHHFYIFIFEGFLAFITAHFLRDKPLEIGFLGLGCVYVGLIFSGLYFYKIFIHYLEKKTQLKLYESFKSHLSKELRVNFGLVMLPVILYSILNLTFSGGVHEEWGSWWPLGVLINIIFISVLTMFCSVALMLRLIPNREIIEPEYLEIINQRLSQIDSPKMRLRWIESDVKNAFVVGLKLIFFSNQTLFVGKSLKNILSLQEFDAVIAHELAHVAHGHAHKRIIDFLKNFVSIILGTCFIILISFGASALYWGEEFTLYLDNVTLFTLFICFLWFIGNFSILFDSLRSQEFEADGFAVIKLGVDFEVFKSALYKLQSLNDLPDYLKDKSDSKKGPLMRWSSRIFSTHPETSLRLSYLRYKIDLNLPFNYSISSLQRIKDYLSALWGWKTILTAFSLLLVGGFFISMRVKEGYEIISYVQLSKTGDIISRKDLLSRLNSRPLIIGESFMYYVVKKRDKRLIDYFIQNGADKGKTLLYITQLKDDEIFRNYFDKFKYDLKEEDFYLILRKTAQINFISGFRLLVNSPNFTRLNSAHKMQIAQLRVGKVNRTPSSYSFMD